MASLESDGDQRRLRHRGSRKLCGEIHAQLKSMESVGLSERTVTSVVLSKCMGKTVCELLEVAANQRLGTPDAVASTARIVRGWVSDIVGSLQSSPWTSRMLAGGAVTRFWQRCDDRWVADTTMRGGGQGSGAMQVMLGLEHALSGWIGRACDLHWLFSEAQRCMG